MKEASGVTLEENLHRSTGGASVGQDSSRPNNLQRIAQRKQQVRNFPHNKKLEKLAVYSSCKVCKPFVNVCLHLYILYLIEDHFV